jgi:hypothetical protein
VDKAEAKGLIIKIVLWFVLVVAGFVGLFYWNGWKVGLPMLVIWWCTGVINDATTKLLRKDINRLLYIVEKIVTVMEKR